MRRMHSRIRPSRSLDAKDGTAIFSASLYLLINAAFEGKPMMSNVFLSVARPY